ncbi:YgcG family protein [Novosphingobium sp. TCA1]|uniref:TPM domain-containing protein n=1 Tax=Novosphingobium sp. TCA1 TaxID=2682474 RepID=UPI00135B10F0|nr:TPM domain-containing protein [Novosphingobium sp. TCA1]
MGSDGDRVPGTVTLRSIAVTLLGASLLLTLGYKGKAEATNTAFAESVAQSSGEALNLQRRVNDAAGALSRDAEERLTRQSEALERATKHQLVIVTTPSLGGETISDYTRKLGNRWGIGRKDANDGIIVLIAPTERQARIEVGKGLTDQLPDELCKTITEHDMTPHFRNGDYAGGLDAGVSALIEHLR